MKHRVIKHPTCKEALVVEERAEFATEDEPDIYQKYLCALDTEIERLQKKLHLISAMCGSPENPKDILRNIIKEVAE